MCLCESSIYRQGRGGRGLNDAGGKREDMTGL